MVHYGDGAQCTLHTKRITNNITQTPFSLLILGSMCPVQLHTHLFTPPPLYKREGQEDQVVQESQLVQGLRDMCLIHAYGYHM